MPLVNSRPRKTFRRRGQIVAEREVLIDDLDAVGARIERIAQNQILSRPSAWFRCVGG